MKKECELYLFTGPEAGDRNDAIATIKNNARKNYGELDEYNYYMGDVRVQDVIAILSNQTLFSSAVFVVLRNAEQIKLKSDIELIASWAKACEESNNTLILVSEENSVDKKLEHVVPSGKKKIFWEMFENRKGDWVKSFFVKNGLRVTDEAVSCILEMVENNKDVLKSECSRFFYCFEKNHTVTAEDVDKILSHNKEENAFTLFNAMAEPSKKTADRFESALDILLKIISSKENNSVALLAGLSYCFRMLKKYQNLCPSSGEPKEDVLNANGFTSKKNKTMYKNASKVWTKGQVVSILSLLSATDMAIRESGAAMEKTRLTMLIYSIVIKSGAFCAVYEK